MESNSFNAPSRAEVEEDLRIRAWKDKDFRQELLANPKAVIEREYPQCFENGKAPEDITYKVIEEGPKDHYIVLQAMQDEVLQLSDNDLDDTTGGAGTPIIMENGIHLAGRKSDAGKKINKRLIVTNKQTNPFCDSVDC